MILFSILAIVLLLLVVISVLLLSVGGTAFIVVFGDLIVCALFIGLLIKFLFKRKKGRKK